MRIFKGFMKFVAACICLGVMVGSVLAVLLSLYAVEITANDAELLDLTNLELAQTSQLLAKDHDTGEWVVVEEWHDSNDREWVDLQEILVYGFEQVYCIVINITVEVCITQFIAIGKADMNPIP